MRSFTLKIGEFIFIINNDISVLFYNFDTYKKYKSVEDFIDDCRKNKWGDLDISVVVFSFYDRDRCAAYDFFNFLYEVTWTRIKQEFVNFIGFRFFSEEIEITIKELLKRMTRASSDGIKRSREVLLDILMEEVVKYDANNETLGKWKRVSEYLECFCF